MKHSLFTLSILIVLIYLAHSLDNYSNTQSVFVDEEVIPQFNPPPEDEEKSGFVFSGLETRESRRSFYGAPPVIPHRIGKTDRECLNCHTEPKEFMGHVSPPSPHPELVNCTQCHVRGNGPEIFKKTVTIKTNWLAITEPKMGSRNHPFAPPTVPHRLHMRDNCAACHNQSHPNTDIRVNHSQRKNCMQCHVPDYDQSMSPFSHEFTE